MSHCQLVTCNYSSCTNIAHSRDILHQFLVVLLDAYCGLVGQSLSLVHLSLGFKERIIADLFLLIENLVAELVLVLLSCCLLFFCSLSLVGAKLVLVESDLNDEGGTLALISLCWQMPLSISILLI